MPIQVACSKCSTVYNLAEKFAGKSVRCQKCQTVFAVPAEEEVPTLNVVAEPPRKAPPALAPVRKAPRRANDDNDDLPIRKRPIRNESSGGIPLPLILGGVGALIVLIGGVVVVVILMMNQGPRGNGQDQFANNGNQGMQGQNNFVPNVQNNPQPRPQNNNPQPQNNNNPRPQNNNNPNPANQGLGMTPWKVDSDAAGKVVTLPDNARGTIPLTGFDPKMAFPSRPSPFVMVSQSQGATNIYEIWDLLNSKKVGSLIIPGFLPEPYVLSADGTLFANKAQDGAKNYIEVWSTAGTGKRLARILPAEGTFVDFQWLDFVDENTLISMRRDKLDEVFQVWDIKTQSQLRQFTVQAHNDKKKLALSNNGKYVAVVSRNSDRILIYDTSTGNLTGEAEIQKDTFAPDCQGLAFSPDGKALAGMFNLINTGRIIVWNLADGQIKSDHRFSKTIQDLSGMGFNYKGHTLEWLGDGSGWICYGAALIDAEKGALFYKIPVANAFDTTPRRLFGLSKIVGVKTGAQNKKMLVIDTLPKDQLAAAKEAVASGEDPAATKLPKAKEADWATTRVVAPGAGAWKASADPAGAGKALAKKTTLQGKAGDLARISFAGPEAGQAVVFSTIGTNAASAQKQIHIDRYDLVGAKFVNGMDLFKAEPQQGQQLQIDADVSPDGAFVAVREPHDGKRVDVWSMADNKHVVGWLPYDKEGDPLVRWVGFLDAKHVLTLNGAGKLVLWDLPDCKAVWSLDGCKQRPVLSAGRKYLAAFTSASIDLFDAAGEGQGSFQGQDFANVWASAFKPDGKEFAAVVQKTEGGTALVRWDAASGAALGEFPIQMVSNDVYHTELRWCGPDQLMHQTQLIDLKLKMVPFLYNIPGKGKPANGSPDGRYWYAVAARDDTQATLTNQTFPDAAGKALAADVAAKRITPLLSPGMSVSVRIEGAAPSSIPDFQKTITTNLERSLKASGMVVDGKGKMTLIVTFAPEKATGKSQVYHTIGRGTGNITVNEQLVEAQTVLKDQAGQVLLERKQSFKTPQPHFVNNRNNEDLNTYLGRLLWQNCQQWANSMGVLSSMVRTPSGVQSLPQPVTLTGI